MDSLVLVAKICYSAIFIMSGLNHFMKLNDMTQYATMKKIPFPKISVMVTGAVILFGGLGILFGYQTILAGYLLIGFLVVSAFTMHNFWSVSDPTAKMGEMVNFMKNLSLAGATYLFMNAQCTTCAM